ncbi:MAG: phage antirepressor KilAC domain-containing protein [Brachybacterium tyrofermentans]|uniref:phage antirepressor KilAC domain-containing protein n=1 Tax=Brachybacterium tyrofermentans TaxID=47848 RepID=UPI001866B878|nr:phage regulatory protein/antirepressor Ant [Brachybacterium tyrofermentans]
MDQLIPIDRAEDGALVVATTVIAANTGVQHKNVLGLVRDNLSDFEDFGGVAFETRPFPTAGGTQHREVAQLNEHQATLLLTFMRNSPIVKAFKKTLVKAFYAMAQELQHSAPEMSGPELMARAVLEANRTIKALEATVSEQQPKADAWDHIVSSAGSWSYEEAAKVLFEQGVVTIGQQRLVARLVEWGYLFRDSKKRPHVYQRHLEQGLFVTKARVYTDQETGETRQSSAPQVRITGKGLDMLFRRFREGQLALPGVAA